MNMHSPKSSTKTLSTEARIHPISKYVHITALSVLLSLGVVEKTYSQSDINPFPEITEPSPGNIEGGSGNLEQIPARPPTEIKNMVVEHPHYFRIGQMRQYFHQNPEAFGGKGDEITRAAVLSYGSYHSSLLALDPLSYNGPLPFAGRAAELFIEETLDGSGPISSRGLELHPTIFGGFLRSIDGLTDEQRSEIVDQFASRGFDLQLEAAGTSIDSPIFNDISTYFRDHRGQNSEGYSDYDLLAQFTRGEHDGDIAVLIDNDITKGELASEGALKASNDNAEEIRALGEELLILKQRQLEDEHLSREERQRMLELQVELREKYDTLEGLLRDALVEMTEEQKRRLQEAEETPSVVEQQIEGSRPIMIGGVEIKTRDEDFRRQVLVLSSISNAVTGIVGLFGGEQDKENAQRIQSVINSGIIIIDSVAVLDSIGSLPQTEQITTVANSVTAMLGAMGALANMGQEQKRWEALFEILGQLLEGQQRILSGIDSLQQNQALIVGNLNRMQEVLSSVVDGQIRLRDDILRDSGLILNQVTQGDLEILYQMHGNEFDDAIRYVRGVAVILEGRKNEGGNIEIELDRELRDRLYEGFDNLASIISDAETDLLQSRDRLLSLSHIRDLSADERTRVEQTYDRIRTQEDIIRNIRDIFPEVCEENNALCSSIEDMPNSSLIQFYFQEVAAINRRFLNSTEALEIYNNSRLPALLQDMVEKREIGMIALEKLLEEFFTDYLKDNLELATELRLLEQEGVEYVLNSDRIFPENEYRLDGANQEEVLLGQVKRNTDIMLFAEGIGLTQSNLPFRLIEHEVVDGNKTGELRLNTEFSVILDYYLRLGFISRTTNNDKASALNLINGQPSGDFPYGQPRYNRFLVQGCSYFTEEQLNNLDEYYRSVSPQVASITRSKQLRGFSFQGRFPSETYYHSILQCNNYYGIPGIPLAQGESNHAIYSWMGTNESRQRFGTVGRYKNFHSSIYPGINVSEQIAESLSVFQHTFSLTMDGEYDPYKFVRDRGMAHAPRDHEAFGEFNFIARRDSDSTTLNSAVADIEKHQLQFVEILQNIFNTRIRKFQNAVLHYANGSSDYADFGNAEEASDLKTMLESMLLEGGKVDELGRKSRAMLALLSYMERNSSSSPELGQIQTRMNENALLFASSQVLKNVISYPGISLTELSEQLSNTPAFHTNLSGEILRHIGDPIDVGITPPTTTSPIGID